MVAPHGSVVLLSGGVTRKAAVEMSTLAAVNGAIEDLARAMALQLARCPGQCHHAWSDRYAALAIEFSETEAQAHFDHVAHAHPVGRVGTADYVAQATLFLMVNGFMSGAVHDIDGGWR